MRFFKALVSLLFLPPFMLIATGIFVAMWAYYILSFPYYCYRDNSWPWKVLEDSFR